MALAHVLQESNAKRSKYLTVSGVDGAILLIASSILKTY
jgi:hypothetical protein